MSEARYALSAALEGDPFIGAMNHACQHLKRRFLAVLHNEPAFDGLLGERPLGEIELGLDQMIERLTLFGFTPKEAQALVRTAYADVYEQSRRQGLAAPRARQETPRDPSAIVDLVMTLAAIQDRALGLKQALERLVETGDGAIELLRVKADVSGAAGAYAVRLSAEASDRVLDWLVAARAAHAELLSISVDGVKASTRALPGGADNASSAAAGEMPS